MWYTVTVYTAFFADAEGKMNRSPYLSRIEGSPPKRNAGGSIPPGDVKKCRFREIFGTFYISWEIPAAWETDAAAAADTAWHFRRTTGECLDISQWVCYN